MFCLFPCVWWLFAEPSSGFPVGPVRTVVYRWFMLRLRVDIGTVEPPVPYRLNVAGSGPFLSPSSCLSFPVFLCFGYRGLPDPLGDSGTLVLPLPVCLIGAPATGNGKLGTGSLVGYPWGPRGSGHPDPRFSLPSSGLGIAAVTNQPTNRPY